MNQYSWNDILIVGDSFCQGRFQSYDWPQLLTCAITKTSYRENILPRGSGYPGASWWSVRNCLINELKKTPVKILVLCHTCPYRIPNDLDYGLNFMSTEHAILHQERGSDLIMPEKISLAGKLYYQELISYKFHDWCLKRWYLELDEILSSHESLEKTIHLFCFEHSFHQFKNGVSVRDALFNHATEYKENKTITNHFDLDKNLRLSQKIETILDEYPGDGKIYKENIL